jgi:hypothetical protein
MKKSRKALLLDKTQAVRLVGPLGGHGETSRRQPRPGSRWAEGLCGALLHLAHTAEGEPGTAFEYNSVRLRTPQLGSDCLPLSAPRQQTECAKSGSEQRERGGDWCFLEEASDFTGAKRRGMNVEVGLASEQSGE